MDIVCICCLVGRENSLKTGSMRFQFHGSLQELQVEFRKRFVAAVQPKNLPASWSVYHEAPREFGMHSIFSEHTVNDPASSRLQEQIPSMRQLFSPQQQPTTKSKKS
jgi:hypothetical protein